MPSWNVSSLSNTILEFLLLLIGNFYLHFCSRYELDKMDKAESKAELGIEKKDLPLLADVLVLRGTLRCPQRSAIEGLEGLCLMSFSVVIEM